MAFKAIPTKTEAQAKKRPALTALGTWKSRMPGRITAEDAEAEPPHKRLFPEV
jgi:hypothetical protein